MSWEGDQQSSPWNAAFTKRQVLARTWTAGYFQELNDCPVTKRAPETIGNDASMQGCYSIFEIDRGGKKPINSSNVPLSLVMDDINEYRVGLFRVNLDPRQKLPW